MDSEKITEDTTTTAPAKDAPRTGEEISARPARKP